MINITDKTDERIRHYTNLRYTPQSHTNEELFIAEGIKVVTTLLETDLEIVSIFAVNEFYDNYSNEIAKKNIPENSLFYSDKALMNDIIGFKIHSGVMAMAKRPDYVSIDSLDDRIVAMNGIINSENVGAIVRNCVAFDVSSILIDSTTASPYLRRSVRVSMGNVFDVKIGFGEDLADSLKILKNLGYKIYAAELDEKAIPIKDANFSGKWVIIFGTESQGVERRILDLCDQIIYIPINMKVSSINVAASSATILYESTINRE